MSELSTSPVSVFSPFLLKNNKSNDENILRLSDFLQRLPNLIDKVLDENSTLAPQEASHDPISELFSRVNLSDPDVVKCAHWDATKNYTRNLVSSDGKRYTLLLLCWNPSKESPIHDHPGDGCWMRVSQGRVRECRYEMNQQTDSLACFSDNTYAEGEIAYISDIIGFHKVGNPSKSIPAVTLHLYCPPFQSCKIWLNPDEASLPSQSRVCFHSEYGVLTNHA